MRRLLVLAAALAVMWLLGDLHTAQTGATDPLTLAAIGFVVLAAFTVGELGGRLSLPKVSGYIVAGVLLGPQVGDILSDSVVGELTVFNTLALGLIATTAGLELDLKAIARVWKTLVSQVLLKIPLLIVLVGGAFVVMENVWPSLGIEPVAILPVALIVAVLGIGTSPAIALAVVNEGRAKGRLTDLLLAIAVVKDLVVVVSLAVALAVARTMLEPGASLDAHVLVHVGRELGSSILVGGVLGAGLIAYIKYVHQAMLLFVLIVVLVIAELSAVLHLELLLVFIVAGFLVRNFSPYEHELLHPLQRIALPVFVVFFTTAGAGVDLRGTIALLPLALTLVVVRMVAYYIAGRVGSAIGGEGPAVRDNAWLTWWPQAGVTLGLVLLAAKALPDLATPLTSIGLALVAINLLVGPITLGIGLRRAGEMGQATDRADGHGHDHDHAEDPPAPAEEAQEAPPEPEAEVAPVAVLIGGLDDPQVSATIQQLGADLEAQVDQFLDAQLTPRLNAALAQSLRRLPAESPTFYADLLTQVDQAQLDLDDGWGDAVRGLYVALASQVQALPERVSQASQPEDEAARADRQARSAVDGLRATGARLMRLRDRRKPPLRLMARVALEGRLAEAVRDATGAWYRARAGMLEQLTPGVDGHLAPELCAELARNQAVDCGSEIHGLMAVAVRSGVAELVDALRQYALSGGHPSAPHYSTVGPQVRRSLERLDALTEQWRDAVQATSEHLALRSLSRVVHQRVAALLQDRSLGRLDAAAAELLPAIDHAITVLEGVQRQLADGTAPQDGSRWWEAELRAAMPVATRLRMRRAATGFNQSTQAHLFVEAMAPLVDIAPIRARIVDEPPASAADEPTQVTTRERRVRAGLRTLLLDELVPNVRRDLEGITARLAVGDSLVAEGIEVAGYGLEVSTRAQEQGVEGQDIAAPVERALTRLRGDRAELTRDLEQVRAAISDEQLHLEHRLAELCGAPAGTLPRRQGSVAATRRSLRQQRRRLSKAVGSVRKATAQLGKRLTSHPSFVERAVRTGHLQVDGEAMRAAVHAADTRAAVPIAVSAVFSLRPVDDRRLFVAYGDTVQRMAQQLERPDAVTPLLTMVVGPRGSGRTSLVNMLQLRARNLRVHRPDETFHDRSSGLVGALAAEMQCAATVEALTHALTRQRTLVLIDGIERFMLPTPAGVAGLDAFLELATTTATQGTQWVVTIESSALQRLEQLLTVGALFNQRVELGELDATTLRQVVEARLRLGGLEARHRAWESRVEGLFRGPPADAYYRSLERVSAGNLASALHAHLGAVEVGPWGDLVITEPRPISLPFMGQLGALSQAGLGVLYQFGPMPAEDLALALGCSSAALGRHLQLLLASQLVVPDPRGRDLITVPSSLLHAVHDELREHRILASEGL